MAEAADIGIIPAVADPDRRARCQLDLHEFLRTYFPRSTGLSPFGEAHLKAIKRLQTAILEGGLFVQVFPRGFAKTTIGENTTLWATLYGHRRFVPLFGADASSACGMIDSIKTELSENDLLYEDFPEVCHPVRKLEGKPQRCASQTHRPGNIDGEEAEKTTPTERTHIEWTADTIVFPSIKRNGEYTPSSGAIITTRGILGGARGMKHRRPDGTQQRPDFIIIDDPQTDESAGSETQINKRLDTIRKGILRLGGHGVRIAVVINATIIQPGDMVEQMMDANRFPAWQSDRIRMVNKWPDAHETLWLGEYARIRNTFDPENVGDQQRAHLEATQFYREHREEMDKGAEVSWEHCFGEGEISAIQHAYNILIDDGEDVFASECQNDPHPRIQGDGEQLDPKIVASRFNGIGKGVVPDDADKVTAFVDVQGDALFWLVAAWDSSTFRGYVIDYGVYPEQPTAYFDYRKLRTRMSKVHSGDDGAVFYAGLQELLPRVFDRTWKRSNGDTITMSRALIDYGYEPSADAVFNFCRLRPTLLLPSKGLGENAAKRAFDDAKKRRGETLGKSWISSVVKGRQRVVFDTNFWKSFVRSGLATPVGSANGITLFGDRADNHRLLADHFTSEYSVQVTTQGRTFDQWTAKASHSDNHWWDCMVGAAVAASMSGVETKQQRDSFEKPKPVDFAELQRIARAKREAA